MASNFEQLIFQIIATDKNASAAFDKFRRSVDQTSRTVDENSGKLDKNSQAVARAAKEAEKATPLVSALAGVGNSIPGGGGGGMGALITAGVALSPVLFTVGAGLAGLGAAAVGVAAPVLKAAQAAGGLQKNMSKLNPEQQQLARSLQGLGKQYSAFQKSLQPQVLGIFGQGIRIAGHLMHDLQPVAKATGIALDGLLSRIDAEFQSGTWQSFFGFMARTAAPDVQLLGNVFINLTQALPPLLQLLQPVATDILAVAAAAAKLTAVGASTSQNMTKTGHSMSSLEQITTALKLALFAPGVGLYHALKLIGVIGPDAGKGLKGTGDNAKTAGVHVQTMADAVVALNTAESNSLNTQLAYSGALITAANDAHTLRQNLKLSGGQVGLHTQAQRNSFSAANQYISDLENSAKQAVASGKGASGAARAIQNGLPVLEQAARHNHALWLEVQTLKQWLDKLRLEKAIHESVTVSGTGHWTVIRPGSIGLPGGTAGGPFATGGRVPGSGTGDTFPAMLTPGEAVVPKRLVPAVAPFLHANKVPGFAAGGIIGDYSGSVAGLKPWSRTDLNATVSAITSGIASSMASAFRSAVSAASSGGFNDTGARSGSAALAQSFALSVLPRSWSWPALLSLWNQESGWNAYAVNQSSGAYGIPQSLGHGHPYNLGDYKAQVLWGINYIAGRYGNSQNAWSHEQAFNWYDRGGWLPPGLSMAYNGTGRPERVGGPEHIVIEFRSGGGQFSDLLVEVIRREVKIRGGGNVQLAFGRRGA